MQLTEQQQDKLSKVQLEESWKISLAPFLLSPQMDNLRDFLFQEKQAQKIIYPPSKQIFSALNTTPLADVKVVILGQDPYHGPNQANGLSFSVQKGIALPPSLRNIFHELHTDLGIPAPRHGDLTKWANQGVLLLNSVLTVEAGQPTSHQKQGWEAFTDEVIDVLNEQREHVVFILWGAYAQRKGQRINRDRHLVLTAAHPSPLAANRGGFFGCKVFSKTNQYLKQHGIEPIDWQLDA
ncbi:Uracil-DNA glycosylase [Acinetobacter calcoaceticus]|uniref:Uracil-DNA glycosylase n=1 Tax=Acinetobacter calcoaceticus DSM 30006 = CIP 81.8 TaxID=981331 RepID=A0ABP2UFN2_ACICA|nr:uracil-DNA glycosylase [Acinetobacter calcoaceticus]EEY78003.1 uracil-DNA glycosylase [Acinetobacter calcoaceticus RUH2202]ENU09086.1 uracil-DNA glycosylase [Acinetobacter calcoaceticus NIPH 13]ENV99180.1 uracil-DNA glycosylase [Acinetobacter calcoaceticus DSM 30006 = CIP 81.8]KJH64271.1 uracil-DNA glycosylase [Acinetobacter calcoaceticus]WNY29996.1 uracil-DNA glycosylase [Acinetobacter calcoaceticus]